MSIISTSILGYFKNKLNSIFAKQDGSYANLGAGVADQLSSTVGIDDFTPYNFRTSGGSVDIGDRMKLNAVVGVSVPWNQLVPTANRDFTSESSDTRALFFVLRKSSSPYTTLYQKQNVAVGILSSVVASSFDGYAEMTHSGSQRNIRITPVDGFQLTNGHKYLFSLNFTAVDTSTVGGVVAKDISVYDLTLALGSSIADYIYALEQSNAGAGVAWFRKYFPKLYYGYSAPTMLSVKASAHKMTGFNQWDEVWEAGLISVSDGQNTTGTGIRSKNFCKCVPDTVYHARSGNSSSMYVFWYDADKNYISYASQTNANFNATSPTNACYFKVRKDGSNTYANDICINLHWDGERDGEYEPYVAHEYALDDITLRGILKLDASNNLYADGDRYLPDGTVERRYGVVDLGSLVWTYASTANPYFYCKLEGMLPYQQITNSLVYNMVCPKYQTVNWSTFNAASNPPDKTMCRYYANQDGINVRDSAYTDAATFKAAMSGVMLVYELATPTTETASLYQQTQIVDDFGTEEFVDAAVEANERDVAIPVGHETFYQNNLKAKLEMAPNSPDGDGVYVVQQTNGENEYVPLVIPVELPTFPSDDGTYVFKITVSDGTVTKAWVEEV